MTTTADPALSLRALVCTLGISGASAVRGNWTRTASLAYLVKFHPSLACMPSPSMATFCYVGSAQRGLRNRLRKYDNIRNKGGVATRLRERITEELRKGADVRVL